MYRCSMCGLDLFDYECDHIPGMSYSATKDPNQEPSDENTENRIAFAWVDNARLSEVSAVYDGATPDAMIVKANREYRAGRLKGNQLDAFEQRTRIHLPRSEKFRGYELNSEQGENDMGTKADEASGTPDKLVAREVAFEARSCGLDCTDDADVLDTVKAMRAEIERLQPLAVQAQEGKELRTILVEETLEEGVRAFGDSFDKEAKLRMLDGLSVETVKEMRSSWKEIGDAKFSGKRQTVDTTGDDDEDEDDADADDGFDAEASNDEYVAASVGGV